LTFAASGLPVFPGGDQERRHGAREIDGQFGVAWLGFDRLSALPVRVANLVPD
jgi:hypothetical protein